MPNTRKILRLTRIMTAFVFIGRGVQFVFWGSPIRHFLYDREIAENYRLFSAKTVDQWMTSEQLSAFAGQLQHGIGYFFLMAGVLTLLVPANKKWFQPVVMTGATLVLLTGLMDSFNMNWQLHQLLEYAIQAFTPVTLVLMVRGWSQPRILMLIKLAIAATFGGHAIYALGLFGQPGTFIDLTIGTFGCSEEFARQFLYIAGALDIVVAVGVFYPSIAKWALLYAVAWGFATALARTVGPFDADLPWYTFKQLWHGTVYRLPHGGLPLVGWLMMKRAIAR